MGRRINDASFGSAMTRLRFDPDLTARGAIRDSVVRQIAGMPPAFLRRTLQRGNRTNGSSEGKR